jgi:hypothetical protein
MTGMTRAVSGHPDLWINRSVGHGKSFDSTVQSILAVNGTVDQAKKALFRHTVILA